MSVNLRVPVPSRAPALSCNKGRIEIPTNRMALLLQWTLLFGSSWRIEAIGPMLFFLLVSAFLVQEKKKMDWEEEGKRDWQMGECKKQELPITKLIVFAFFIWFLGEEREISDFLVKREREGDSSGTQTKCLVLLPIFLLQLCVTVTNSKYLKVHAFCLNYQKAPSFVLVYKYLTKLFEFWRFL